MNHSRILFILMSRSSSTGFSVSCENSEAVNPISRFKDIALGTLLRKCSRVDTESLIINTGWSIFKAVCIMLSTASSDANGTRANLELSSALVPRRIWNPAIQSFTTSQCVSIIFCIWMVGWIHFRMISPISGKRRWMNALINPLISKTPSSVTLWKTNAWSLPYLYTSGWIPPSPRVISICVA